MLRFQTFTKCRYLMSTQCEFSIRCILYRTQVRLETEHSTYPSLYSIFHYISLPKTLARYRRSCLCCWLRAPFCIRHCQLVPSVDGKFILALLSSFRMSCVWNITTSAILPYARRNIWSTILRLSLVSR